MEESIKLSSDKRFKNSHLAKVLVAGLNELQFQQDSTLRPARSGRIGSSGPLSAPPSRAFRNSREA
ncbi:MAG: hypothetical protein MZU91_00980 [Desulfosudis oleivorans]|nr:hypothetical protein [Desulfosudis oleivorans]